MIYKTLKKVRNVCQLIKNGTFQDGFNGWSSQGISYNIIDGICYCTINGMAAPSIYTFQPTIIKDHKYLISFDIFPNYINSANTNGFYLNGEVVPYNIIQKQWNKVEKIGTVTLDTIGALVLYVNSNPNKEIGDIANFKNIQLFDLTEMYGAGHEPTSVEQFRQDFPEEMYDYSPNCWLTSYKRVFVTGGGNYFTSYKTSLVCKTKNLWTCNKNSSFYTYDKNTQVFTIFGTGLSSCYTLPTPISAGETFTISVYCLSGEIPSVSTVVIGGYHFGGKNSWQAEVTLPVGNVGGKVYYRTATTTDTLTDFLIFVYQSGPTNLKVRVQFERGSTATDYVPYGHL